MLKSLLKKAIKINYILFAVFFVFNYQLFSQNSSADQAESLETTKNGGVIFRVTGNHSMEDYLNYASLFNERGKNFSFTIGLGDQVLDISGYPEGIRQMQDDGNELLDPTPNYRTNYFQTIFNPQNYEDMPGVDHIIGNKICLEFESVDVSKSIKMGYLDILNDKVYAEHEFDKLQYGNSYLFFPSLNAIVLIDEIVDNDLISIKDVWDEPIFLGEHLNEQYYWLSVRDISIKHESMLLLGWESFKLATHYNLIRPYTWIQPAGNFPNMSSESVKNSMGDKLGYLSGEVYSANRSLMTYNEYDPIGDRRFAMLWGNFREDEWTVEESKTIIADYVAKNRVAISHGYFGRYSDESIDYLTNTTELLDWCIEKNIPIATHSQWAENLYNTIQNPYINIFPLLNTDLDEDGFPDGYSKSILISTGELDKTDGAISIDNYSMFVSNQSEICFIDGLGGADKGENSFEIYTKGSIGNFITVSFKLGKEHKIFKFPAESTDWTKYDLTQSINENKSLIIPDSVSLIDISIICSDYTLGDVKISGMSLKSSQIDEVSPSAPQNVGGVGFENRAEISWAPNKEEDIKSYSLYRSTDSQFDPDTLTSFIYSTADTFYVDTDVEFGQTYYYKVSAFDFAGNLSDYSPSASVFITTDVLTNNIVPERFELYQNFPNPFNPTTKISFAIPQRSNVKLAVYNIIGQMVAELINTEMAAGYHTVDFNAANYSSGLYFFRITARDFVDVKKMMLLK